MLSALCVLVLMQDVSTLSYPRQSLWQPTCTATAAATGLQKIHYLETGVAHTLSPTFVHLQAAELANVDPRYGIGVYSVVGALETQGACLEVLCPTTFFLNPQISSLAAADAAARYMLLCKRQLANYDDVIDVVETNRGAAVCGLRWPIVAPRRITDYSGLGVAHALAFVDVQDDGDVLAINPWHPERPYEIAPAAVVEMLAEDQTWGFWHSEE